MTKHDTCLKTDEERKWKRYHHLDETKYTNCIRDCICDVI